MGERELTGTPVSPGRAVGPAAWAPEAPVPPTPGPLRTSVDEALVRVADAGNAVRADLLGRAGRVIGTSREVIEMTAAMAQDPAVLRSARKLMTDHGMDPASAVWQAAETVARTFEERGGLLAARATDVRDVRDRLVAHLIGTRLPGLPQRDHPYILLAGEVSPADAATLDPARVLAIATVLGDPRSHTAILARDLGIPAVVGLGRRLGEISEDEVVGVDGERGTVLVGVDPARAEVGP